MCAWRCVFQWVCQRGRENLVGSHINYPNLPIMSNKSFWIFVWIGLWQNDTFVCWRIKEEGNRRPNFPWPPWIVSDLLAQLLYWCPLTEFPNPNYLFEIMANRGNMGWSNHYITFQVCAQVFKVDVLHKYVPLVHSRNIWVFYFSLFKRWFHIRNLNIMFGTNFWQHCYLGYLIVELRISVV